MQVLRSGKDEFTTPKDIMYIYQEWGSFLNSYLRFLGVYVCVCVVSCQQLHQLSSHRNRFFFETLHPVPSVSSSSHPHLKSSTSVRVSTESLRLSPSVRRVFCFLAPPTGGTLPTYSPLGRHAHSCTYSYTSLPSFLEASSMSDVTFGSEGYKNSFDPLLFSYYLSLDSQTVVCPYLVGLVSSVLRIEVGPLFKLKIFR